MWLHYYIWKTSKRKPQRCVLTTYMPHLCWIIKYFIWKISLSLLSRDNFAPLQVSFKFLNLNCNRIDLSVNWLHNFQNVLTYVHPTCTLEPIRTPKEAGHFLIWCNRAEPLITSMWDLSRCARTESLENDLYTSVSSSYIIVFCRTRKDYV